MQGTADVVEYLGNEELLHVTAAEKDIVAIVDSSHRVKPDDVLKLILPLSSGGGKVDAVLAGIYPDPPRKGRPPRPRTSKSPLG